MESDLEEAKLEVSAILFSKHNTHPAGISKSFVFKEERLEDTVYFLAVKSLSRLLFLIAIPAGVTIS